MFKLAIYACWFYRNLSKAVHAQFRFSNYGWRFCYKPDKIYLILYICIQQSTNENVQVR